MTRRGKAFLAEVRLLLVKNYSSLTTIFTT